MNLTDSQVAALAPDAGSAGNGRKLAALKNWKSLGRGDRALWGECQGSALYQVQVALGDFSTKCSCPSRKFPCKHALGLLFLAAQSPDQVPAADEPDWVEGWLSKRDATAKAKETRAAEKPPDPEKQAKRAAQRQERVAQGVALLDAWMADLVRGGIAGVERQPDSFWESQAARLVDCQASGLAGRVRRMAAVPRSGGDWPERLLRQLGQTALLTEAFKHIEAHDPALQADIRQLVGFTLTEDEVRAHGDRVQDRWLVAGQWASAEARSLGGGQALYTQRTWLKGLESGRWALVMQFDARGGRFERVMVPGTVLEAELAFWPSAWAQRALIGSPHPAEAPERGHGIPLPGGEGTAFAPPAAVFDEDFDGLLEAHAEALAHQPWVERVPCLLAAATPQVDPAGSWWLVDGAGQALPLGGGAGWKLLALSGGRPLPLACEWSGEALRALTAWVDGAAHPLGGD